VEVVVDCPGERPGSVLRTCPLRLIRTNPFAAWLWRPSVSQGPRAQSHPLRSRARRYAASRLRRSIRRLESGSRQCKFRMTWLFLSHAAPAVCVTSNRCSATARVAWLSLDIAGWRRPRPPRRAEGRPRPASAAPPFAWPPPGWFRTGCRSHRWRTCS